jgi:hypothetical protein
LGYNIKKDSLMIKIYVYPHAPEHSHDTVFPIFKNTVPLSISNLKEHHHIEIVDNPYGADFYYMGQWTRNKPLLTKECKYLKDYPHRHIIDIEGEGGLPIPEELHNVIITTNGPLRIYEDKIKYLFVRPTFSKRLLDLCHNNYDYLNNTNRKITFRGYINHPVRIQVCRVFKNQNIDLVAHGQWLGLIDIEDKRSKDYIDSLTDNTYILCPRGTGIDSVRLLESCLVRRIPILISDQDYILPFEWCADTSFIQKVIKMPFSIEDFNFNHTDEEIIEMQNKAFNYGNTIKQYMKDPTSFFMSWLTFKGLL